MYPLPVTTQRPPPISIPSRPILTPQTPDVVIAGEVTYCDRNIVRVDLWESSRAPETSDGGSNRNRAIAGICEWDPFGDVVEYVGLF